LGIFLLACYINDKERFSMEEKLCLGQKYQILSPYLKSDVFVITKFQNKYNLIKTRMLSTTNQKK